MEHLSRSDTFHNQHKKLNRIHDGSKYFNGRSWSVGTSCISIIMVVRWVKKNRISKWMTRMESVITCFSVVGLMLFGPVIFHNVVCSVECGSNNCAFTIDWS